MPRTTTTHGTKAPVQRGGQRRRCRTCGVLRPRSYFMPSSPRKRCSYCRRLAHARARGCCAEAELLQRYGVLDPHLAVGLGIGWPVKLLNAERGFYA